MNFEQSTIPLKKEDKEEKSLISTEELKENPGLLWSGLYLGNYGYFTESQLNEAMRKFLIKNNIVEKENVEDGLVHVESKITQEKVEDGEQDVDFIKYKCRAEISIDSDVGLGGSMMTQGMGVFFDFSYVGDSRPKFLEGKVNFR